MSFAGHVLHMINVLSQNKDMRKANRAKLKKSHSAHSRLTKTHQSLEIKRKDISDEELEKINAEIKTTLKRQKKQEIILAAIITLALLSALISIAYYIFK